MKSVHKKSRENNCVQQIKMFVDKSLKVACNRSTNELFDQTIKQLIITKKFNCDNKFI